MSVFIDYAEIARSVHPGFDASQPGVQAGIVALVGAADRLVTVDGRAIGDLTPAEQTYARAIQKAAGVDIPAKNSNSGKPKGK